LLGCCFDDGVDLLGVAFEECAVSVGEEAVIDAAVVSHCGGVVAGEDDFCLWCAAFGVVGDIDEALLEGSSGGVGVGDFVVRYLLCLVGAVGEAWDVDAGVALYGYVG